MFRDLYENVNLEFGIDLYLFRGNEFITMGIFGEINYFFF